MTMGDDRDRSQDEVAAMPPEERPGFPTTPGEPGADGVKPDWPLDAGAYIGHEPEMAADRIPGGVRDDDQRVAAHSTQGTGAGRPDERGQPAAEAGGHRETEAGDDTLREAGQNR
jgi:hypothetical protein